MYEVIREKSWESQLQRFLETNKGAVREYCAELEEIFGKEQYEEHFYTIQRTFTHPYDPLAHWSNKAELYVSLEKNFNHYDGVWFITKPLVDEKMAVALRLVTPRTPFATRLRSGESINLTVGGRYLSGGMDNELSFIQKRITLSNINGRARIFC